jgi:hypothetical protein
MSVHDFKKKNNRTLFSFAVDMLVHCKIDFNKMKNKSIFYEL